MSRLYHDAHFSYKLQDNKSVKITVAVQASVYTVDCINMYVLQCKASQAGVSNNGEL